MRNEILLKEGWYFTKDAQAPVPSQCVECWEQVSLPHTWNALDGQDGGADYFRGDCRYYTELKLPSKRKDKRYYLHFECAQYDCTVKLNGAAVCEHKGGYSAFVADVTDTLREGLNELVVCVSNAPASDIYPQMADFTFYGGLTGSVKLLELPVTHFELEYYAGPGISISADVKTDASAVMHINSFVKNAKSGDTVRYTMLDEDESTVFEIYRFADDPKTEIELEWVHLWQGISDPYLYTLRAEIIRKNEVIDSIGSSFGFRSYSVDPEKGFILNGKPFPLRGVSRHQDKLGKGSALNLEDHVLDMNIMRKLGANTVRLAHYQQNRQVYELCDRYGFIVWAEIPFISKMSEDPEAHKTALLQMKELIIQNYNHPSICFWGIANEITIAGKPSQLENNLKELNALCKKLDAGRLTTIAQVTMLSPEDDLNKITDTVAYNHYFGWYGGELSDNEEWLDNFHSSHPQTPIGISEYGSEGIISYHSDTPKAGDYTEEYQCLYHEHMLKVFEKRQYVWATFVWNMFDFGCDARNEGGVKGRNNKGLVSFDRKIKKDAFYLYQSYWNDFSHQPVVHICSKRYFKRSPKSISVKVYSNAESVELYLNGKLIASQSADKVFVFDKIELKEGLNTVSAVAGEMKDVAYFEKSDTDTACYTYEQESEETGVTNWFDDKQLPQATDMTFEPTHYSIKDTLKQILESPEASTLLVNALSSISGMQIKKSMLMVMAEQTLEQMISGGISRLGNDTSAKEKIAFLNQELQKIKKV